MQKMGQTHTLRTHGHCDLETESAQRVDAGKIKLSSELFKHKKAIIYKKMFQN